MVFKIDWESVKAIPLPTDPRFKDLRGKKFGRLSPYELVAPRTWRCRCDCGAVTVVRTNLLLSGEQVSCSCFAREMLIKRSTTHNLTRSSEYACWRSMLARCSNPKHKSFAHYGGRGIRVCDRWKNGDGIRGGFECFLCDMGRKPSSRHSIDRRNNNLGYSVDNCCWALPVHQTRNRSNTVRVTFNGVEMTLTEACTIQGIDYYLARNRMLKGMPVDVALSKTDLRGVSWSK